MMRSVADVREAYLRDDSHAIPHWDDNSQYLHSEFLDHRFLSNGVTDSELPDDKHTTNRLERPPIGNGPGGLQHREMPWWRGSHRGGTAAC